MSCIVIKMPKVVADFCAPVTAFGEIDTIYLGNQGRTPFTDVSSLVEWEAAIDNDTLDDLETIRKFHVIGSKPAAETTSIDFSKGRKVYTEKNHTVPIKIDEVHEDNYAFLQFTEEHPGQQYKLWYEAGGFLYGGPEGIDASLVLNEIIPESNQELIYFEGSLTFEGKSPNRITSPLA